jgi:hypothetical protein
MPDQQYTQQQATDALIKTNEKLAQVNAEATNIVAVNKKLQEELTNAGGPGGTITPELAAAIQANGTAVDAIEALLPDTPQPES